MNSLAITILWAYLVSYAMAVVMPTWRWLVAITLVVGVVIYAGWPSRWVALLIPHAQEGPGGGLAAVLVLLAKIGFATGVVVRGLTFLFASWGLRRSYVILICAAGSLIAPSLVTFAPGALTLFRF